MNTTGVREYIVVFRAPAALRFEENSPLAVRCLTKSFGSITVTFRTRYDQDGSLDTSIPRELWIDARGHATGINDAINEFGMAVSRLIPVVAVSENTAILELHTHLAFENTSGATEREFFQSFVPDERGMPRISIRAKPHMTARLLDCVGKVDARDRDRVLRACAQYHQALMYWAPGQELLALAHLYMGIEALTKTVLRQECVKRTLDEDGLAAALGVGRKELDSTIRREIIFCGDRDCYSEAKKASDGFEHGFLAFDELQALAAKRRNKTGTYLRAAILSVLAPPDETRQELDERAVAVGAWRIVRNFRGLLLGKGDELAAPGQEYPILNWRSSIKRATKAPTGEISLSPEEQLTARLAEGITLKPSSSELWGPETNAKREPIRQTITPKISQPKKPDPRRDDVVAFLERLARDVLEYGGSEPVQTNFAGAHALAIFAACRSQFQAITLLVKEGLPNEAMHIAHSLAKNSERLRLLIDATKRTPLTLGLVCDYMEAQKTSPGPVQVPGFDIELRASAEQAASQQERLMELARTQNVAVEPFPYADPDLSLASPLYSGGFCVSKFIADGFGALMGYSKSGEEGLFGFNNVCEDAEQIAFTAAFASESGLLACSAIGQILSWPKLEKLDARLEAARSGTFKPENAAA
jgi:hypothetical protein